MTETLKWLGPGYFGEKVAPGDDMPDIDKKRLDKFIKLGKVGTIAEKVDLEKIKSDTIDDLEKENASFKKTIVKLEKKVAAFEKELADLVEVSKKKDK